VKCNRMVKKGGDWKKKKTDSTTQQHRTVKTMVDNWKTKSHDLNTYNENAGKKKSNGGPIPKEGRNFINTKTAKVKKR